jgi:hypothetical protein
MGRGGHQTGETRGRTWRRIAGAASSRFDPPGSAIVQPAQSANEGERASRKVWTMSFAGHRACLGTPFVARPNESPVGKEEGSKRPEA